LAGAAGLTVGDMHRCITDRKYAFIMRVSPLDMTAMVAATPITTHRARR
jgi:hypothetical protein